MGPFGLGRTLYLMVLHSGPERQRLNFQVTGSIQSFSAVSWVAGWASEHSMETTTVAAKHGTFITCINYIRFTDIVAEGWLCRIV